MQTPKKVSTHLSSYPPGTELTSLQRKHEVDSEDNDASDDNSTTPHIPAPKKARRDKSQSMVSTLTPMRSSARLQAVVKVK